MLNAFLNMKDVFHFFNNHLINYLLSFQILVTLVFDGMERLLLLIDDGIVICVSDEHPKKA